MKMIEKSWTHTNTLITSLKEQMDEGYKAVKEPKWAGGI
jgi:hypothetical protein